MDQMSITGERRRRGVTAAQVALEMDITREALGLIERGKITVTPEYVSKIEEAIERVAVEVGANK